LIDALVISHRKKSGILHRGDLEISRFLHENCHSNLLQTADQMPRSAVDVLFISRHCIAPFDPRAD
jgi:hypothetical protein